MALAEKASQYCAYDRDLIRSEQPGGVWNTSNPRTQDAFVCEGSPEMLDVSIEDGARLLEFVVSDERLTGLQVHNISWQSSDI
jgi:hypothetical protein